MTSPSPWHTSDKVPLACCGVEHCQVFNITVRDQHLVYSETSGLTAPGNLRNKWSPVPGWNPHLWWWPRRRRHPPPPRRGIPPPDPLRMRSGRCRSTCRRSSTSRSSSRCPSSCRRSPSDWRGTGSARTPRAGRRGPWRRRTWRRTGPWRAPGARAPRAPWSRVGCAHAAHLSSSLTRSIAVTRMRTAPFISGSHGSWWRS